MVFWDHALANSGEFSTRPLSILRRAAGRGGGMARKKKLGVERKDKPERKIVWHARGRFFCEIWWTRGDSNPRPPHCERGKFQAETRFHNHLAFAAGLLDGRLGLPDE